MIGLYKPTNKLSRTHTTSIEAIHCLRRKGQQKEKVTAEHVHVHTGGQAIVGARCPPEDGWRCSLKHYGGRGV
jgi:hypothetical protein